jgi:hypothetical protein
VLPRLAKPFTTTALRRFAKAPVTEVFVDSCSVGVDTDSSELEAFFALVGFDEDDDEEDEEDEEADEEPDRLETRLRVLLKYSTH